MSSHTINGIIYEITNILIEFDARWANHWLIKMIRSHCFLDWVEWKTEQTMAKVDRQIVEITKDWEVQDHDTYIKPIITEHKPDGSKAQDLLGGTLEISSPWYHKQQQENQKQEDNQSNTR